MTTMIQRVARECERRINPQWDDEEFEIWWSRDSYFCDRVTVWPDGFRGTRKQRRMYEARNAIEAMREPTYDMMVAGSDEMTNGKQTWTAMIDAALKEHA